MDFFQWLSSGSISSSIFIAMIGLIIIVVVLIFTVAFLQGREISFWPPKIGEKSEGRTPLQPKTRNNTKRVDADHLIPESLPNNDLGKGIKIGGAMDNVPFAIVASDWARFGRDGWVRSGWLHRVNETPERSGTSVKKLLYDSRESHAIAFFKIHLADNGNGYIHILDAANPVHTIWLETSAHFRKEQKFCWDADTTINSTDLWKFTWQYDDESITHGKRK